MDDRSSEVTRLLQRVGSGDGEAREALVPLVYEELHRIAAGLMGRENPAHTLQPTALLNEAYLRLFEGREIEWNDRAHFLNVAAATLRRVLIDHARRHLAVRRAHVRESAAIEDLLTCTVESPENLVEIDQALEKLAAIWPRKARVVELRFFAGLDIAETAKVLEVGSATVERDWALARAWLHRELSGTDPG